MLSYSSLSPDELIKACAGSRNSAAWQELIRRFQPVIAAVVFRTARRWGEPSSQTVDDLVQETYLKLCADDSRLLRSFRSRHPEAIFGFLKVVAANVVRDHYKSAWAEKRGAGQTDALSEQALPATSATTGHNPGAMERHILLREIDEAVNCVAAGQEQQRNRLIFWLYYRHGLSASAIAALPGAGLTTKGVESTILRMTRMIRSHILERQDSATRLGEGFRSANSF